MKTTSSRDAQRTLDNLRGQVLKHKAALTSVEARRRKYAFRASQDDPSARAALAKVTEQEQAANAALRDLTLAITEAERRVSAAHEHEHQKACEDTATFVDEVADELIDNAHSIAETSSSFVTSFSSAQTLWRRLF